MTEPNTITPRKALKLRKRVKGKKPRFVRPESWRYFRLKENWRNPRGLDHKVRLMYKGWPPAAGSGYGGPRLSRGLHPSGFTEVLVYNVEQLSKIEPKTQAVRIGHRVGKRKKANILAEARRKKIVVLNLREVKETREKKVTKEEEEGKTEETEKEANATEKAVEGEEKTPEEKTGKRKGRTVKQ
jgi:large subunit ribosomal protein L32e